MAIEDARIIFSKNNPKQIDSIVIDAFVSEIHKQTATATNFPVEEGSEITDHVITNPFRLDIQGIISPTQFGDVSNPGGRIITAYGDLTKLKEEKQPISIVTGLAVYSNMIIEVFTVPRNSKNGGSLTFNMSLKKMRVVKSQATTIPNSQLLADGSGDELGGGDTKQQSESEQDIGKTTSGQTQEPGLIDGIKEEVQEVYDILGLGELTRGL